MPYISLQYYYVVFIMHSASLAILLLCFYYALGVIYRRERKGTFRDTSSTASTEGQRSRYSFKIPRPFANYMSQKEYDSNQISYPSTNFDSDISSSSRADDIQTDGHNSISSEVLTH